MKLRKFVAKFPGARPVSDIVRRGVSRLTREPIPDVPELLAYDDSANATTRRDIWRLQLRNRIFRSPIVDVSSPVVVTMTTYAARIATAHIAIESVARGDLLPFRHIMYIDDPNIMANLPRPLRRLQRRGLEIREVPAGYKVHTKHHFYVTSIDAHDKRLATHEDDIIFPRQWLAELVKVHDRHPNDLVTPRAHRIRLEGGLVAPYASWRPCTSTAPSRLNFGTTVSGQIYPAAFLDYVRDAGEGFLETCPRNDDLWLHHLAVESGRRVVQTEPSPQHFPFIPGTQATGLYFTNIAAGENDVQIAATYTRKDIALMASDLGSG